MKIGIKALFIHFFVLVLFIVASLAYFHPVLQGKKIFQSDIAQYTGMAKEQADFRNTNGKEPYWTNSAFGGMPTYQLGANYPHNYVKQLDGLIRFLPRPADYLFLYFIGFYILLCCMKVDYRLSALGALAFGFSTYLIIILGVGHNAKAHAIGYLPIILAGIILTFRKKYIWGFILTALAMALEVSANHYQMTYYFMLLVLVVGATYLLDAIQNKTYKNFFISLGILIGAVFLGILVNATSLMATKEYADWSTRGKTELTINPDGSPKESTSGLDKEYITQYSYGIAESMNLFVPRLFGGSNSEDLGTESNAYTYLTNQGLSRSKALEFSSGLPLYWGDQPIVAAPAYIGAIVFFLFIMGIFLVKGRTKWWLVGGTIMALLLSWGKNFGLLTDFMIEFFPLYDKFRAVSSIQVILELCAPILAIMALVQLFKPSLDKTKKLNALKISFLTVLGFVILLFLFKGTFDFVGQSDDTYRQYFGDEIMTMIQLDREAVYISDLIRSLVYVLLAAIALWLYLKERIKENLLTVALGVLIIVDLVGVDLRYVNETDFVRAREMEEPFQETAMDKQIAKDPGIFRVYDPSEGLNGARTSYFHQSIGGYHAAKPAALQELFEFHVYKNNMRVLNMLNVKYVVQQDEEGRDYPALNPYANGNAWFITDLISVTSANKEMQALDSLDVVNEAVFNKNDFPNIAPRSFPKDASATIKLVDYKPNHLTYRSISSEDALVVFSEMYYANGWHAYIDGIKTPHFKVNYILRAMKVPAGNHKIEFKFQPEVIETGGTITLASSVLLGLFILGGIGFSLWSSRKKEEA
ncbi:YfhO family protein [Sediminicola sp. 1XM1-17]|uniref:YfhO family protein n=1 Tax=Sediminicola sp. 1XM1-17 TaxID=3127702 RepID=UPI003077F54B